MFVRQEPARHCCRAHRGRVTIVEEELLDGCQPLVRRQAHISNDLLNGDQSRPIVVGTAGTKGVDPAICATHKVVDTPTGQKQNRIAELQQRHAKEADDLERLRAVLSPTQFRRRALLAEAATLGPAATQRVVRDLANTQAVLAKLGWTGPRGDAHEK
jgi:hypothetical protein